MHAAAPVQQRTVQCWACIGIDAKFAMICEERGGSGTGSLGHPQHFVQVIIRISCRAPKHNNHIVNLKMVLLATRTMPAPSHYCCEQTCIARSSSAASSSPFTNIRPIRSAAGHASPQEASTAVARPANKSVRSE
jgi:hypothetical protein